MKKKSAGKVLMLCLGCGKKFHRSPQGRTKLRCPGCKDVDVVAVVEKTRTAA